MITSQCDVMTCNVKGRLFNCHVYHICFLTFMYIAYASFVIAAKFNWLPWNRPLTYVTGYFVVISLPSTIVVCSCVNTPAHPYLLASVNIVYGLEVSGYLE